MDAPPLDFNTALANVELFNRVKHDSSGNFAKLLAWDLTNTVDDEVFKNNVARFFATCISLGICQRYREQNKMESEAVQRRLKASIDVLYNLPPEELDKLTPQQLRQRQTALTTFNVTLFKPRCFLGNFYHYVLGTHNTLFKEPIPFAFTDQGRRQLQAARNATVNAASTPRQAASLPGPSANKAALAIQHHGQLAPPGGGSITREEENKAGVGKSLFPLQKTYHDLATTTVLAEEEYVARQCGYDTVSEFDRNKRLVLRTQTQVVKDTYKQSIAKWREVDQALVQAAMEVGYVNQTSSDAINRYYDYLNQHPQDAAERRRVAEARMGAIVSEVGHEVMQTFNRDISDLQNLKIPQIFIDIMNFVNTELPNILRQEHLRPLDTFHFYLFKFVALKVITKLEQDYAKELQGADQPLIQYQMTMLALKSFGISNMLLSNLNKAINHYRNDAKYGLMINQLIQMPKFNEGLAKLEPTREHKRFNDAFVSYIQSIQAEQTLHREMIEGMAGVDNVDPKTVKRNYEGRWRGWLAQPSQKLQIAEQPKAFSPQDLQIPDLDINSLGIRMTELTPEVTKLAQNYGEQLGSCIVGFIMSALFHPFKVMEMVEEVTTLTQSSNDKPRQIDGQRGGGRTRLIEQS